MPESPDKVDAVLFQALRREATQRLIEFLTDPVLAPVRSKLQRGSYGLNGEQACRIAVLSQVGLLGEPGARTGLLVFSLETVFGLVDWAQVAQAVIPSVSEFKDP